MKKNIVKILTIVFIIGSLMFWIKNVWAVEVHVSADLSVIFPSICSKTICNVPKGVSWFHLVLSWIIKYLIFIASLSSALFIVINWILYSMSWMDSWLKESAKKRIIWTLIWLIMLLLSWVILHILAPWVYA